MAGGKKYAVLVGCNYPQRRNPLSGCTNDVLKMRQVLLSRYGFEQANIVLMTDISIPQKYVTPMDYIDSSVKDQVKNADHVSHSSTEKDQVKDADDVSYSSQVKDLGVSDSIHLLADIYSTGFFHQSKEDTDFNVRGPPMQPTGLNIKLKIGEMVTRAKAGDVLFFHFSGHGTRIPAKNELPATTAIIPSDRNLITDVDFRMLLRDLPKEASFIFLSDACRVGGGIMDKKKEQAGPVDNKKKKQTGSVDKQKEQIDPLDSSTDSDDIEKYIPYETILSELAAIAPKTSSNIYTHLAAIFGNTATISSLPKSQTVRAQLPQLPDHSGILLGGCEENIGICLNVRANGDREAYGRFSDAVVRVLEEDEDRINISNKELIMRTREILKGKQIPCLYCSNDNVDAKFLRKPDQAVDVDDENANAPGLEEPED